MTIDMSKYLGIFTSESTEHLESLGREIVQLEKDKGPGIIDSMFRHAHSVKGMAASMGFEAIATLAHRVEDLVDVIRTDRELLNQELVDLLLNAADTLLAQVKSAGAGRPTEDAAPLLAQLGEKLASLTGRAPQPTRVANAVVSVPEAAVPGPSVPGGGDVTPVPAAASGTALPLLAVQPAPAVSTTDGTGLSRFTVKLRIPPTCQVPGVRGFLVHKKLSALGQIFDFRPALDDLKAGRIPEGQISLELETSKGETAVSAALNAVPEVELMLLKAVAAVVEAVRATPVVPGDVASPAVAMPSGNTALNVAAAPASEAARPVGVESARTIRVRTELLDYFLDQVGELLLATARIREVGKTLPRNAQPALDEAVYRLHGLVKDLHDKVMTVRMTPLSLITDRLPRAARDIARRRAREVDLIITGAEIELDRAIIDDLSDPLLHILRNCIDHGIEPPAERVAAGKPVKGKVTLTVRRQRDRVVIELEDDGRGMDAERLRAAAVTRGLMTAEAAALLTDKEALMLSCLPGVSTAKDISEISGRGVGMDAVKRTAESVGGALEIESERGKGTRFTLRLPLTVAVVQLLLVQVGSDIFGLPIAKVLGAIEADSDLLSRSREQTVISFGTSLVPVFELASLLEVPKTARIGMRPYVVMEGDTGKVALAVDRLLGQEEVVLKALSRPLDQVPGLSGVTILGSGRPVFILDVPRLLAA